MRTGQLFFPARLTEAVYVERPYTAHGTSPDTSNPQDAVFRSGGSKGMLTIEKRSSGYAATITMGVHA